MNALESSLQTKIVKTLEEQVKEIIDRQMSEALAGNAPIPTVESCVEEYSCSRYADVIVRMILEGNNGNLH